MKGRKYFERRLSELIWNLYGSYL